MNKLLKKVGYGVGIHYNEYSNLFQVYKIGTYSPGNSINERTILIQNKKLKKAIKLYIKTHLKVKKSKTF